MSAKKRYVFPHVPSMLSLFRNCSILYFPSIMR